MVTGKRKLAVELTVKSEAGTKAVGRFKKELKGMSNNIAATNKLLGGFQKMIMAAFAGYGLRQLSRSVDQFSLLRDRISAFYGPAEDSAVIMKQLSDQAADMNTSVRFMADGFNKASIALSDLGANSQQVTGFMRVLNQTFRLSGASIQAAEGALIQLTEGLASGTLRGRELRSVVEQNAVFAGILAKELGIATGRLIKWGKETGGIQIETVLDAMINNWDELNEKASNLAPTFEQTFTVFRDKIGLAATAVADKTNILRVFNAVMVNVGDNVLKVASSTDLLAKSLGSLSALVVTLKLLSKVNAQNANNAIALGNSIGSVTASITALKLAIVKMASISGVALLALSINSQKVRDQIYSTQLSIEEFLLKNIDKHNREADRRTERRVNAIRRFVGRVLGKEFADFQMPERQLPSRYFDVKEAQEEMNFRDEMAKRLAKQEEDLARRKEKDQRDQLRRLREELAQQEKLQTISRRMLDLNERFRDKIDDPEKRLEYLKEIEKIEKDRIRLRSEGSPTDLITEAEQLANLSKKYQEMRNEITRTTPTIEELNAKYREMGDTANELEYIIERQAIELKNLEKQFNNNEISRFEHSKRIKELQDTLRDQKEAKHFEKQLKALNKQWDDGAIKIGEYNKRFKEIELEKASLAAEETGNRFEEMKKSLRDSNRVLDGVKLGIIDYAESLGSLANSVAGFVTSTFGRLEDQLVEFTMKGKMRWSEMVNAMIADLNRLIIRQAVLAPIAQGITGLMSPDSVNAKGNIFSGGDVVPFAKGGIVSGPTFFPMNRGRTGLMGEAGPEVIAPLKRTSSGEMGIQSTPSKVTVNVHNTFAQEAETSIREHSSADGTKEIDIYITKKMGENISSGRFDPLFSRRYGLRSRGN